MSPKVLVVDDEKDFVELLEYYLECRGYEVITATNGSEALTRVKQAAPNVVLLDLMLPDIDGISLCEMIRSTPETARVPVVMVSQLDNAVTRFRSNEAGANGYFNKSVALGDLEDCVRSLSS